MEKRVEVYETDRVSISFLITILTAYLTVYHCIPIYTDQVYICIGY